MTPLRISAPAKLNLFLHVTGKRADGYHLLESLVAFTDFGDVLELRAAEVLTLEVTGPFAAMLADTDDNLILKAARALGGGQGAHIVLHKHIPVGAGLGGGSSDAAAALLGLRQLWNLPINDAALHTLAMRLGSDVPVCLARTSSWMRGVGEQLTPAGLPDNAWAILANPRIPLSTADVFRRYVAPPSFMESIASASTIDSFHSLIAFLQDRNNDLESPAMGLLPVIGELLSALRATPGCTLARMSGSGASCFGLYEQEAAARQAAEQLRRAHPAWWCVTTQLSGGAHGQTQ